MHRDPSTNDPFMSLPSRAWASPMILPPSHPPDPAPWSFHIAYSIPHDTFPCDPSSCFPPDHPPQPEACCLNLPPGCPQEPVIPSTGHPPEPATSYVILPPVILYTRHLAETVASPMILPSGHPPEPAASPMILPPRGTSDPAASLQVAHQSLSRACGICLHSYPCGASFWLPSRNCDIPLYPSSVIHYRAFPMNLPLGCLLDASKLSSGVYSIPL
ncbi:hypothetical protein PAMP_002252 [Pampus punctatissimus]